MRPGPVSHLRSYVVIDKPLTVSITLRSPAPDSPRPRAAAGGHWPQMALRVTECRSGPSSCKPAITRLSTTPSPLRRCGGGSAASLAGFNSLGGIGLESESLERTYTVTP